MKALLGGRGIVVTRPAEQAAPLAELIAAVGGVPLVFPLLRILPESDTAARDAALARLDAYDFAAFVSPNAVACSVPALLAGRPWPPTVRPVAVGTGTARALAELGVGGALLPPARFDSEALLELPELSASAVRGRKVVIFRGDGGRELLADTLRARGAEVDCVSCYRRLPPDDFSPLLAWLAAGHIDALAVSSSEALRHLLVGVDLASLERLRVLPLFVSHPRIATTATAHGFHCVAMTAPGDQGLIDALCAYNWRPRN